MDEAPTIEVVVPATQRQVYQGVLQRFAAESVAERLWAADASLWYPAPPTQARIRQRLGWLDLPDMGEVEAALHALQQAMIMHGAQQIIYVVPGVLGRAARLWVSLTHASPTGPALVLVESADPETIAGVLAQQARMPSLVVHAGAFDTPQAQALAAVLPAGHAVPLPPNVGERFGALSAAALLPAIMQGLEWQALVRTARQAVDAMHTSEQLADNHYLQIGALLGTAAQAGRDLLHLVAPPPLEPVADWLAALVGGALGKHQRGFVPVNSAIPQAASSVVELIGQDLQDEQDGGVYNASVPVVRWTARSVADVARLVLVWQLAVASTAIVIGLNPFDAPDADIINARISTQLTHSQETEALPVQRSNLSPFQLKDLHNEGFIVITAYLPQAYDAGLRALQQKLAAQHNLPVLVVYPLRDWLWSLQLLHAGRPNGAILVLSSVEKSTDPRVAPLVRLQQTHLRVELETWQRLGRSVTHVQLDGDIGQVLRQIT